MLPAPKPNERFLDDVLGIRPAVRPTPREEEQGWTQPGKTVLPIVIGARPLHDLFTVF
jgi:hypothetical protein